MREDIAEPLASDIILAHNTHKELLGACKQSLWLLNKAWNALKEQGIGNGYIYGEHNDTRIKTQLEAAIAKTEKGG